ncbi:MAG: hypothetical protein ACKO5C_05540 [Ferruginibacter sp.]
MRIIGITFLLLCFSQVFSQDTLTRRASYKGRDIILFSDGSWQYTESIPPLWTIDSSLFEKRSPRSDCAALFCPIDTPNKPYVYISLESGFEPSRWAPVFSGKKEFYKECAKDGFRQIRFKYTEKQVINLFPGIRTEYIQIDAVKDRYLARVIHLNGLESWYYPVRKPLNPLSDAPGGAVLGESDGVFFWQMRLGYRTISLLDCLTNDFTWKIGYLIMESADVNNADLHTRKNDFITSIQKINKEIDADHVDFDKEFNKETQ